MNELNSNYEWILKIIRSSFTVYQFDSCENLIKSFIKLYPEHENMGDVLMSVLKKARNEYLEIYEKE